MIFTQRVFWPQIADPRSRGRLLAFLARHRDLCQEISFFTEGDGGDWRWLPPAEVAQRAGIMADAVREARVLGFAVAVNVLNTLGHSDGGGPDAPLPGWRTMVGHDGAVARVVPCPRDPGFLADVRGKYRAFAMNGAGRYWIDDDLRLHNHAPVQRGCFCAACVEAFAARSGCPADRAAVVAAIDGGDARPAWELYGRESLDAVIDAALAGVRDADPTAEVGLMTCDPRSHGPELARIAAAAPRAWIRPGGGFWNDAEPRSVLIKQLAVAAQCADVPAGTGIAYEVENYPYAIGAKSAAMTGMECLLAIGSGRLDGILFDVLDGCGNDPEAYDVWLERLATWTPHLRATAAAVAGTRCLGWALPGGPDRVGSALHQLQALQLAGLPIAIDGEALGWVLPGHIARSLTAGELAAVFDRPVLMDGDAAAACLAVGLGDRIGLRGIAPYVDGVHERFASHALNGDDDGFRRAFTLSYFGLKSHALDALPGAADLSRLVATGGRDLGAAMTLHAPMGTAPVAVIGHAPWTHALSAARIRQLGRLSDAMLGVPMRISSDGAMVRWLRRGPGGDVAVLANPGFDPVEVVCRHAQRTGPAQTRSASADVAVSIDADGTARVALPPWSAAVLAWPS